MSDASNNALESTARDRRSVGLHLDISSIHPSQPDGAGALLGNSREDHVVNINTGGKLF